MPVGTNATVKALDPDDLVEVGAHDHPRQHVPPVPAARPRADRAAGRAARVHGLGPADPDRLGRLPGGLAGRPARDRRRRRRRSGATSTARSTGSRPSTSIAVQEALGAGHRRRLRPAGAARRLDRGGAWPRRRRGPTAGRSARWPPTRGPTRRCSASSRAAWSRTCGRSRPRSSRRCRSTASASAGWPGDETPAQRDAALDVVVPLLADDPRPRYLMGLGSPAGPARGGPPGRRPVRLGAAGARRPQRPAVGARRPPQPAQRAVPATTRGRSRTTARACSAAASRGPIWPTCSGPTSCSRTASRLVTT